MATAFCSGLAETGGLCGALTGGILALSLVQGRRTNGDTREKLYANTRKLIQEFEERFENKNCPDLIHLQLGTPEASAEYQARGLKPQCEQYIRQLTRQTVELLMS